MAEGLGAPDRALRFGCKIMREGGGFVPEVGGLWGWTVAGGWGLWLYG